jgi:hypothetical protein
MVLTAQRIEPQHLVVGRLRLKDFFVGVQEFEASQADKARRFRTQFIIYRHQSGRVLIADSTLGRAN